MTEKEQMGTWDEIQCEDVYDEEPPQQDEYRFEVTIDIGKPFTEGADSLEEVREILRKFYRDHVKGKEEQLPHVDIIVMMDGIDISNMQCIEEIAADIVEEFEDSPVQCNKAPFCCFKDCEHCKPHTKTDNCEDIDCNTFPDDDVHCILVVKEEKPEESKEMPENCPDCNGTGEIWITDTETKDCAACGGSGEHPNPNETAS